MSKKQLLSNGSMLLYDFIPTSQTVSIGFWVKLGSRDEQQGEHGFCHYTEHMLFKGTKRRSFYDIAREIDSIGGEINGITGKETTNFYINIASDSFLRALEVLSDMFFFSSFERTEFEKERLVILDEIDLNMDDPDELVSDLFSRTLWGDHPLGYPVIGEKEAIGKVRLKDLKNFYHRHYRAPVLIVSVAGNFEEKLLPGMIESLLPPSFSNRGFTLQSNSRERPEPKMGRARAHRDLEQIYFTCGREGPSYADEERYALALFNIIVGSSFSSRLFQKIREGRGLCYSISSSAISYCDGGEFTIGFSTSLKNIFDVLDAVNSELKLIKEGDIKREELENAKRRFKGNYLLAQESNEWKMARMAVHEIMFGRVVPYDETLRKIEGVTLDDLNRLVVNLLQGDRFSSACIGPEGTERSIQNWQFSF